MQQIRSMTGFGKAEAEIDGWFIKVEISAVNGKYADIKFRVPQGWQMQEQEWRNQLLKKVGRGTVQVVVTLDEVAGLYQQPKALINKELFNSYTSQVRSLIKDHDLDPSFLLPFIVKLPGVQMGMDESLIQQLSHQLSTCVANAFNQFDKHRLAEGNAMAKQLASNIARIKSKSIRVESLEEMRNDLLRQKLTEKVDIWSQKINIEKERLESEILFYLDKFDITEEKTRLEQHCVYFEETLNEKNPGKKLGFIAQELGREINTLGNKANHFDLQKLTVEMKEELEKIKEQVLNLL